MNAKRQLTIQHTRGYTDVLEPREFTILKELMEGSICLLLGEGVIMGDMLHLCSSGLYQYYDDTTT